MTPYLPTPDAVLPGSPGAVVAPVLPVPQEAR